MEESCAPSTSGRAILSALSRPVCTLCLLVLSCALASGQWVVETNSFRIKEPASSAGEHDAAIGDVSLPHQIQLNLPGHSGQARALNEPLVHLLTSDMACMSACTRHACTALH